MIAGIESQKESNRFGAKGMAPQAVGEKGPSRYTLIVSSDADHRIAAQRLRYNVLAAEPGFTVPDAGTGLDADRFDEHCDHVLVRDEITDEYVGCYRMLPPDRVAAAGGSYTAAQFDLTNLDPQDLQIVELGRACVAPGHRNGSVLTLLWTGIGRYLELTGYNQLIGSASVPMQNSPTEPAGVNVRGVRDLLLDRHACAPEKRVHPYRPVVVDGVALDDLPAPARPRLPPLLNGYLRLGAEICGEPAHNAGFAVADFVVLLGIDTINTRYLERLRAAVETAASAL